MPTISETQSRIRKLKKELEQATPAMRQQIENDISHFGLILQTYDNAFKRVIATTPMPSGGFKW